MKKILPTLALAAMLGLCAQFTACKDARAELAELAVANKATCRKSINAMNTGDLSVLDSIFAADYIEHSPDPMVEAKGIAGLKESYTMMRTAFPDVKVEVINSASEGDRVMIHQTITGTNTGMWGPMTATGKAVKADGVDIFAVKDGKITEHWAVYDAATMMEQLGYQMVPPGAAPADSAAAPSDSVSTAH